MDQFENKSIDKRIPIRYTEALKYSNGPMPNLIILLETRNQKPETRNQKPETRNQKPETRNQKPETRNQKLWNRVVTTTSPRVATKNSF
jgi:hypothetical protein